MGAVLLVLLLALVLGGLGFAVHVLWWIALIPTGFARAVDPRRGYQIDSLVYGTLGTMFNDTPGVLDALIAGLEQLDVSAVVTTGGRTPAPRSL